MSYQTYKQEFQTTSKKKKALEKTKLFLQNELVNSPIKSVHDNCIAVINTELEAIETPKQPKLVSFVCNKQKLLTEVNKLCKLVERMSDIDYTSKTQSIISVCDKGTGNEQLNDARGVTVDHNTGNIYVADYCNRCVKVFDNTAKYSYKFGNGKGERKMSHPKGLLIRDNKVFVSHNHRILVSINWMESLFLESVMKAVVNYNSTSLVVYLQMNPIMIFIFVILTTIEFKLSLKTFNTSLNLVKIL